MSEFKNKVMERLAEAAGVSDGVPPLHGKSIPINTPKFKGTAHLEYEPDYNRKGRNTTIHSFSVKYKGHFVGAKVPDEEHNSSTSLDVSVGKLDGKVWEYSCNGSKSRDNLSGVLHKAAPQWVPLEALRPGSK